MRLPASITISVAILGLNVLPAAAQTADGQSQIHLYAGSLFGDDLTDQGVSGDQPELDDAIVAGLRYGYNVTGRWGIEASLGWSPDTAAGIAAARGGEIDMDVFTLDVDAVWSFTPDRKAVGYVVFGAGYATADLEEPIRGVVGSLPVTIDDDNGFTLNAGIGLTYFATDHLLLRADARYRYIDALVDAFDDSLNTFEGTAGVGWAF